jgi:hypothetical protein
MFVEMVPAPHVADASVCALPSPIIPDSISRVANGIINVT